MNTEQPTSSDQLMQVFRFDAADLAANRAGQVSAAQKRRALHSALALGVGLVGFSVLLSAVLLLTGPFPPRLIHLAVAGLLLVTTILFTLYVSWRTRRALGRGPVASVAGPANFLYENRCLSVCVDGLTLPILHAARAALAPGAVYQIYYLPGDQRILSIERLLEVPPDKPPAPCAQDLLEQVSAASD